MTRRRTLAHLAAVMADPRWPTLSNAAGRALLVAATFADDGGRFRRRLAVWAEVAGMAEGTLRRATRELAAAGLVEVEVHPGRHRANDYRLTLENRPPAAGFPEVGEAENRPPADSLPEENRPPADTHPAGKPSARGQSYLEVNPNLGEHLHPLERGVGEGSPTDLPVVVGEVIGEGSSPAFGDPAFDAEARALLAAPEPPREPGHRLPRDLRDDLGPLAERADRLAEEDASLLVDVWRADPDGVLANVWDCARSPKVRDPLACTLARIRDGDADPDSPWRHKVVADWEGAGCPLAGVAR